MTERCTFDDVFTEKQVGSTNPRTVMEMNAYLADFAKPDEFRCVNCDKKLVGGLVDQLIGEATFRWGLVHGQGHCTCGWPVVMYHFPKQCDAIERFESPLCVHPDLVKKRDG